MKKTNYIALAIALCYIFSSCSLDTPPVTNIQLEEDVELNLWQELTENGSIPQLQLVSTETYQCTEAKIISEYSLGVQKITLELKAIDLPDNCSNADPAYLTDMHSIDLASGEYDLLITIGDIVSNEGTLDINSDQVEIKLNSSDGIKHTNSIMHRIPENTAWGYLIDSNNQDELTSLLLDSEEIPLNTDLPTGNYSYFEVEQSGIITVFDLDNQQKGFIMRYHDNSDWEQIVEHASDLDLNANTTLFLQNFDGRTYRN